MNGYMKRGLIALGIAALLSAPVHAAMEPDNVATEVTLAADDCKASGGTPNTDAMLTVDDFNGDGAEDWLVDFSRLDCAGAINPYCGSGGCSLEIFFWEKDDTWTLVFDELVHSYAINGKRLDAEMGGSACGKPNFETCKQSYSFTKDGVVPR